MTRIEIGTELNCDQIANSLRAHEQLYGGKAISMEVDDDKNWARYEDGPMAAEGIAVREGAPQPQGGEVVIFTASVYVKGRPHQTVTAYRGT